MPLGDIFSRPYELLRTSSIVTGGGSGKLNRFRFFLFLPVGGGLQGFENHVGNKIPKEIYPFWSDGGRFFGVFPRVFFGDGTSDENGRPLKI